MKSTSYLEQEIYEQPEVIGRLLEAELENAQRLPLRSAREGSSTR